MSWYDYVPGVSNIAGIAKGDPLQTVIGPGAAIARKAGLTPSTPNLSGVQQAQTNAFGVQNALAAQRDAYRGQYNPRTEGTLNGQGLDTINSLRAAAAGQVPSAAEIQLRNQAAKNAANSFGVAAALQGRSPAGALHQALVSNAGTQAQTNSDAAALRAQEMATARGQLVGAIQGQQQNELGQRQTDTTQTGNLLQGQIGALNAGTTAAVGNANAQAQAAAAKNAFTGSLINTGVTAGLLSDEREKTDIHHVDLEGLAKALEPFRFKYKDPENGPGERVGIMAQDAEKGGPAGRAMVRTMPDGAKGLDLGNAVGTALAMAAEALKRTRKAA